MTNCGVPDDFIEEWQEAFCKCDTRIFQAEALTQSQSFIFAANPLILPSVGLY
jgi:hypothetical protein